jgi:hypothetical protein
MPKLKRIQTTRPKFATRSVFTSKSTARTSVILRRSSIEENAMLQSYMMKFDGHLLNRGFWLYVWEIKGPNSHHVYVGRTGDSSSAHASSPFKRIGQHLDPGPNAKGNALIKQLIRAGVNYSACSFEMVAIRPIWPEQDDFDAHKPIRDQMAAFERAVADDLKNRGYNVLGAHPRPGNVNEATLQEIRQLLDPKFPDKDRTNKSRIGLCGDRSG